MEFQTTMQQQPPVPSIQQPSVPSISSQPSHARPNLKSYRRTSLPASVKTTEPRPPKRRPNAIRTQAASPQVISSLIDQLSAGSIPSPNHFENLLPGYDSGPPVSPNPSLRTPSARNSFTLYDGAPVEQILYYNSIRDQNELYPDDACESPVIRTSKPPSGLSALTAPKKRPKPHSLSSYIGRSGGSGGGSSTSLHSDPSIRSVSSIGNISVEAPATRPAPSDSNRSSAESKRSAKAHRSLMYMSSRERLKQKETERKRVTVHNLEDLSRTDSAGKPSPQLFPYEDTIKEEPYSKEETQSKGQSSSPSKSESSKGTRRYPSSPRRIRINFLDEPSVDSPADTTFIPERGSSLKHSSPPRKGTKGKTDETRRNRHSQPNIVLITDDKMPKDVDMKEKFLKELEQEENDVAQRIRELKEQKIRRDKVAGKMPVETQSPGSSPPKPPRDSPLQSPGLSPISPASTTSEMHWQDSSKAHKMLGLSSDKIATSTPMERSPDRNATRDINTKVAPQTQSARQSLRKSLHVNDAYDNTPLPINYALAVRSLEESPPSPPPLLTPQTKCVLGLNGSPKSSRSRLSKESVPSRRPSSANVPDRPSIGHRSATTPTNANNKGDAHGHKHSSSATDASLNMLLPPLHSNSEDVANRHKSLHVTPTPVSKAVQVQRRRTLTKKRWSQPDLPLKAELTQSSKGQRSSVKSAAEPVQAPSQPVVEERAASLDSIDTDVESYLNSPRLSQKIRHPQTGRVISFSEVGDPHGYAIFVCLGMGLTRFVMAFYDQLATTLKLRLITPDRPGIGGSQVDPNGTPLSWPGEYKPFPDFAMFSH